MFSRIFRIVILATLLITCSLSSFGQDKVRKIIHVKIEQLDSLFSASLNLYYSKTLKYIYSENQYNRIWDTQKTFHFIQIIENSSCEGFEPEIYHLDTIKNIFYSSDPEEIATRDIILSDAFLLYAHHLLHGLTTPKEADLSWHLESNKPSPEHFLLQLRVKSLQSVLQEMRPQDMNYAALCEAMKKLKTEKSKEPIPALSANILLKRGDSDYRIEMIKKRLVNSEYPKDTMGTTAFYYDTLLEAAVKHFQKLHGIYEDGIIGKETIDAFNLRQEQKLKTLMVNLERLRWMPGIREDTFLLVNIPDFQLKLIEQGEVISTHKIIVGRIKRKTPVFSSTMEFITLNPPWVVPPNMMRQDIIPAIKKDPGYLGRNHMKIFDRNGNLIDPQTINWNTDPVYSYTYRQEPGVFNSLGLIKFSFPNPYSIYLHDTPSRSLFLRQDRAFSSGCIRVERPFDLSDYLLIKNPEWTEEKILRTIAKKMTITITLNQPIKIYFLYLTAWVDQQGELNLRKDIYDKDDLVYKTILHKLETLKKASDR